jgi:DNA-binding IclR family transcriptional regulator
MKSRNFAKRPAARSKKQLRSQRSENGAYPVPALEKGLDVLEFLSQARRGIGLNEIAAALGRSRHELFRVVTCLSTRGYVLRDSAGNYRLGSQMLEVGSRHVAEQALVAEAMSPMERLAETVGESCQLSLVGRERLLVVAGATGSSHLQLEVKVGSSIPLYLSVIGLVALAFGPEEERKASWERRRALVRKGEDVFEPEIRDAQTWQARLAAVRKAGHLAAPSPSHLGSRVHAAPIQNASGRLAGVLSIARLVAVRETRGYDGGISEALVACCRKISGALGAAEEPAWLDAGAGDGARPRRSISKSPR